MTSRSLVDWTYLFNRLEANFLQVISSLTDLTLSLVAIVDPSHYAVRVTEGHSSSTPLFIMKKVLANYFIKTIYK